MANEMTNGEQPVELDRGQSGGIAEARDLGSDDDLRAPPHPENSAATGSDDAAATSEDAHRHAGMAHVVPLPVLFGVFGVLVVLTIATVAATSIDLGPSANLAVAMVIATIKAMFVMAIFMHLLYDRSFNLLLFLSAILFVVLFISPTMLDRAEYQTYIDQFEAAQKAQQTPAQQTSAQATPAPAAPSPAGPSH